MSTENTDAPDQEQAERDVDYLIAADFDEAVMVNVHDVRQTINAVYINSVTEILTDHEYEVAYVIPVSDQKKIQAVVAVPVGTKMSVIPYGTSFDWLIELRKYDSIEVYEDGSSLPLMDGEHVFHEWYC